VLLRASLTVTIVSIAVVAVIWALFRRLEL
jgi:hypothetical protein